ncbi:tetratricopeptide repeat protein [Aestuariicoccus sp. KMU-90]|uniref:Tetratricopeptide repeat protein n=2 Tax=Thetidibacter halocola TaxID=2827239 RepID=A0A8J8B9D3_9RHOB|nr:tetratricopeptide repeat protein [Thetidibacter halocola]
MGDFEAAARHYGRALAFDNDNPELLERAVLANMSLGDVEQAAAVADRMADLGLVSQIAQMALITRDGQAEKYAAILMAIEADRGLGPLSDRLTEAWAQLGQGDMSAALVAFDEAAQLQGLGPFATYHKALALASVGDFESAEALFAGSEIGGMAMTRRGVMARVQVLSQLDRFDEAVQLIDTAFGADLDPGLAAMRASVAAKERLPFDHIRSARDGMAEVFYTVAGALSNENSDDLTLLYARMAHHLRPDHTDAILLAAEVLYQMRQYKLAERTYAEVSADDPSFHAAELGRTEALRQQDQTDDALAVLEALAESHGDLPIVHSTRADLLRQLERHDEAIAAYTAALDRYAEITQRQWFLFYARGISHERLDHWDEAEADFRKALELNPDQPQVLNYLGYSLVEQQRKLDEALNMIERAVAARPDSGYIVDSLGWVLYRLGRYEEAVGHMERAAELMPIDPVVNDHLGDVYWAVGRKREAEFMWKRALSFAEWEDASEDVDIPRIRRKIEVGLDLVLSEEGSEPLRAAAATPGKDDDG